MKRLLVTVLLLFAVPGLAFGQAAAPARVQTAEQEAIALEQAWLDAAMKYDVAWLERHIADTLIMTNQAGVVTDKAGLVANWENKVTKYESVVMERLKVRVYGDMAVATGIWIEKSTAEGKDTSGSYPWTDIG